MKNWIRAVEVKILLLAIAIVSPILGLPVSILYASVQRRPVKVAVGAYVGLLLISKYLLFHNIKDSIDFLEDIRNGRWNCFFEKLGL